ncbi:MAG TPA: type II secretion system F family protein [Acidimicrobiales bacterium]|nr:type II secretion system F family protein [Acidimicrobiales bacterium]
MTVLIALLVALAAGLVAWAVSGLVLHRRRRGLEVALAPYSVGRLTESDARAPGAGSPELVELPFLQRAVAGLADLAARRGVLQAVEVRLEQADLPLRAAEVLFVYVVAVVLVALIGALAGGALWCLVAGGGSALVPWVVLKALGDRRTRAFTEQLPDMLQVLSTSLRSGFSVLQGLDAVSRQLSDPIGKEMRAAVAEARLGRPLVAALSDVARRVRSEDFNWVVSAIGIQREIGGNLAELLDIVAGTMLARARLRQEAKTLTAEGRIGALIISVMPVAIGMFVYAVNPAYIAPLFHNGAGELIFYSSVVLAVIGIVWIRRIVHFEV